MRGRERELSSNLWLSKKSKELDSPGGSTEEGSSNAGDIRFYQKGACTIMSSIAQTTDRLDGACGNIGREGLRTLFVGRKKLSIQRYKEFSTRQKSVSLVNTDKEMGEDVPENLQDDLEPRGVTGVENRLKKNVMRESRFWMLGDKVEIARCAAVSVKLVSKGRYGTSLPIVQYARRPTADRGSREFLRNLPEWSLTLQVNPNPIKNASHRTLDTPDCLFNISPALGW